MPTSTRRSAGATSRGEIVDELNRLMAEEAEASLRYFHMRYRLSAEDQAVASPLLDEAVGETLEHAAAIAGHIKQLGHVPTLRVTLALGGGPMRLEAALAEALDVEQQALDAYRDLLPRVGHDPALREFVQHQIDVETEHVESMRAFAQTRTTLKPVPRPQPRERTPS